MRLRHLLGKNEWNWHLWCLISQITIEFINQRDDDKSKIGLRMLWLQNGCCTTYFKDLSTFQRVVFCGSSCNYTFRHLFTFWVGRIFFFSMLNFHHLMKNCFSLNGSSETQLNSNMPNFRKTVKSTHFGTFLGQLQSLSPGTPKPRRKQS